MLKIVKFYLSKLGYPSKDIKEFYENYYSHPNYPSLLAITDTLSLLGIENVAANVPFNNINNLPNTFVSELVVDNKNDFYIIEKVNDEFFISKDEFKREKYSLKSLASFWTGLFFLVEEKEKSWTTTKNNKYLNFFLLTIIGLCAILIKNNSIYSIVQMVLTITGVLLSLEINKSFFNDSNNVDSKFCNYGNDFSCKDIIKSNIKIVEKYLSFADLPILFFSFSYLLQVFFPNLMSLIGLLSGLSLPILFILFIIKKLRLKNGVYCVCLFR